MTTPLRVPRALSVSLVLIAALTVGLLLPDALEGQSLRGSPASLDRQNQQARAHDFTYLDTPAQVRQFVAAGYLVPITPNRDFDVHNVSFPYARPEVRVFIERLAAQYRAACGEKLVVTSLTRPRSNQPRNASSRSVHPTGMAVDLRRSGSARCRNWLESTLLSLESQGVLEAIYERNPPHYHIAVYPRPYAQHVARITGNDRVVAQLADTQGTLQAEWVTHRVARGETLSGIAARYGSTVSRIQGENGVRGNRIVVGQELRIPVYREGPAERTAPTTRTADASAGAASVSAAYDDDASADAEFVADAEFASDADALDDGSSPEPAATSTASATSSAPLTHTVARGESLWLISRRYGVSEADILAANDLAGTTIQVGQTLNLPGGGAEAETRAPRSHTVASGESLWTIARRYGVTEAQLQAANGLRGSRILVGQELVVPGSGAAAATALQHTVARGESLWAIARRHGITVDELQRRNGISGGRIYAGQVLEIPVTR